MRFHDIKYNTYCLLNLSNILNKLISLISSEQKDDLNQNGFLIIRNVFSSEEVTKLTNYCTSKCSLLSYDKSVPGDVFDVPELRTILFKKEIINLMKEVLQNEVTYFRDSQIHCKPNRRIFHTDARHDYKNPRDSVYPIFRLGVFLQDHKDFSGGIKFRSNSHRRVIFNKLALKNLLTGRGFHNDLRVYLNTGKIVNARTKLGDLVIWNLRTEHSGGAVLPKFNNDSAFLPKIDEYLPNFLKLPEHDKRMSIFYTFGQESKELEDYVDYKKNNLNDLEHRNNLSNEVDMLSDQAKSMGFSLKI
jgi:hypothetical protein